MELYLFNVSAAYIIHGWLCEEGSRPPNLVLFGLPTFIPAGVSQKKG